MRSDLSPKARVGHNDGLSAANRRTKTMTATMNADTGRQRTLTALFLAVAMAATVGSALGLPVSRRLHPLQALPGAAHALLCRRAADGCWRCLSSMLRCAGWVTRGAAGRRRPADALRPLSRRLSLRRRMGLVGRARPIAPRSPGRSTPAARACSTHSTSSCRRPATRRRCASSACRSPAGTPSPASSWPRASRSCARESRIRRLSRRLETDSDSV